MRVLFLVSSERWGGAESYVVSLAHGLAARGHEPLVATPPGSPLEKAARNAGLEVNAFHLGPKLSRRTALEFMVTFAARRAAARRSFESEELRGTDIVHLQFKRDQIIATGPAARAGFPVVWTEHGPLPAPIRRWPFLQAYRGAAQGVSRIIAVSTSTRDELARAGLAASRLRVIPNGVDEPRADHEAARSAARAALGLDAGAVVVGYFGRLTLAKGIGVLLDAWGRLAHGGGVLLVAGEGGAPDRLRGVPRVMDLGFRSDISGPLAAADIVIVPSVKPEGMPLVLLEAMAAGCAVIATDTGGSAEAVGDAGVIVEPGDADALARAIADLRADGARRAALGRRGRDRVRDRFTKTRMVDETLAAYEEAVRERRAARGAP